MRGVDKAQLTNNLLAQSSEALKPVSGHRWQGEMWADMLSRER